RDLPSLPTRRSSDLTQRDRLLRQHQGHAILGEGGGMVAEQIARELIQHYDLRQSAFGAGAPVPQLAGSRLPVHLAEALTNQLIQRIVTLPPVGWLESSEPECRYCLMHALRCWTSSDPV